MKRKQLLATGLVIMASIVVNATENNYNGITENNTGLAAICSNRIKIDLHIGYDDPITRDKGIGRAPIQRPSIYMDGRTIYLNGYAFDEIQLVMLDENGEDSIVFSSIICEGTETIEIPDDIIGEYEIRFCRDGYYFYGEVMF